jgi:hypothetical protein
MLNAEEEKERLEKQVMSLAEISYTVLLRYFSHAMLPA